MSNDQVSNQCDVSASEPTSYVVEGNTYRELIAERNRLRVHLRQKSEQITRLQDGIEKMQQGSAERSAHEPPAGPYSIEPHGDGHALYSGRDQMHHGFNLARITEATPETLQQIERALNATASQPLSSDDAETFAVWRRFGLNDEWLARHLKAPSPPPESRDEFRIGDSVRTGPWPHLSNEYTEVMTVTGVQYYLNHQYSPFRPDQMVRVQLTKPAAEPKPRDLQSLCDRLAEIFNTDDAPDELSTEAHEAIEELWEERDALKDEVQNGKLAYASLQALYNERAPEPPESCVPVFGGMSRAALAELCLDWMKANGPGGWIDDLRKRAAPPPPAPLADLMPAMCHGGNLSNGTMLLTVWAPIDYPIVVGGNYLISITPVTKSATYDCKR